MMNERNDEEQLEHSETENPVQSLKTVSMLLMGLYKRFAQERDAITLSSGEMAHAVKQFQGHLTQFEAFEKACRNYVADGVKKELRESVPAMANELSKQIVEHSIKPIHESVTNLHGMTTRLQSLYDEEVERKKTPWVFIGLVFFLISLLGGFFGGLAVHRFTPGINEQISETMFSQLSAGRTLINSWPKLSKEEKDKIIKSGSKLS